MPPPAVKDGRYSRKHPDDNVQSSTQQDMDISPGDSTPTSEVSYGINSSGMQQQHHNHQQSQQQQGGEQQHNTMPVGPVLLANALPRLLSHPIHSTTPGGQRSESSPQNCVGSVGGGSSVGGGVMANIVTTANAPGPPPNTLSSLNRIQSQTNTITTSSIITTTTDNVDKLHLLHGNVNHLQRPSVTGDSAVHTSLSVDTNHAGTVVEGPPTPTHSEIPDCSKGWFEF